MKFGNLNIFFRELVINKENAYKKIPWKNPLNSIISEAPERGKNDFKNNLKMYSIMPKFDRSYQL